MLYLTRVYKPIQKKVEAIQKWPISTNNTEVCSFLAFTNYYHKFIKKYAQKAKTLYKLISGENAMRKHNSVKWDPEYHVRMLLTNLKSCALAHNFWHVQILRNHLNYIWMQAFPALELSYIKNKMELKRLLVMPVNHYQNQNQNIPSIS